MSEPYLGEIRSVGFNFAPVGWALCNGALLSISQNSALFDLLGTTYGGDGVTTFALPDLQGRTPLHQSGSYAMGVKASEETVTLTATQISVHSHVIEAQSATGNASSPANNVFAASSEDQYAASHPMGMRCVTGRYCPSVRIRRCFRCSAQPLAATAPPPLHRRICRAAS